MNRPLYCDYQATTPLHPEALKAMLPYLEGKFGNPHSAGHVYGWEGEAIIDVARDQIAEGLSGRAEDIIFTSGATESNNLVIQGVWERIGHQRPRIVTAATDHKCVLEAAAHCERQGADLVVLPVGSDGRVDMDTAHIAITDQTALVSIMTVNNEIGVVQDIAVLAGKAQEVGALMHTDAAQAFGKLDLAELAGKVDFMSLSAHKIYGPKGVGALYVRAGKSRYLRPQMHGGGQEQGLRSGTLSPALIAGFGKAAAICLRDRAQEEQRMKGLWDRFARSLASAIPDAIINGSANNRWWGNMNITLPVPDGDRLMADLPDLALSSGAACASAVEGPSYVLAALGVPAERAKASLRIGFGRDTTEDDIDTIIAHLVRAVGKQG